MPEDVSTPFLFSRLKARLELERIPRSDYDIRVRPLDVEFGGEDGAVFRWYWAVERGGKRINGGLAEDPGLGRARANRSIDVYEDKRFLEQYYFDSETARWYKRGELPPLE